MNNPLMSMMKMPGQAGGAQRPAQGMPMQLPGPPMQLGAPNMQQPAGPMQLPQTPMQQAPNQGFDINSLLQSIFQGSAGQQSSQPGPAAPAPAFNPFTYGQSGGERTFMNNAGNPISEFLKRIMAVPAATPAPPIDLNRMSGSNSESDGGGGRDYGFSSTGREDLGFGALY